MTAHSRTPVIRSLTAVALLSAALAAQAGSMGASSSNAPKGFHVSSAAAAQVQIGQTQDEVRAELGRPAQEQHFKRTDTTVWRYDTPGSASASQLLVEFDTQGNVTSVNTLPSTGG